jgi:hypothetical protein
VEELQTTDNPAPVSAGLKRKASDDIPSTASTRRKSVGPSMAHEALNTQTSTSISSRTRRKSVGPAPQPEPSAPISGRSRRKSLDAKTSDTHASADVTMAPIDLTTDSPLRRSSRQILSISTPILRTPASSPTKGTTRKPSVSPSKRAARSASPSPTKKVARSYSMVGGRPDRECFPSPSPDSS